MFFVPEANYNILKNSLWPFLCDILQLHGGSRDTETYHRSPWPVKYGKNKDDTELSLVMSF